MRFSAASTLSLWFWLVLFGAIGPVSAQVSPEEHASHHPDESGSAESESPVSDGTQADPASGMGGMKGKGGMGDKGGMGGKAGKGGMGGMMKSMGVPPPKELYPSLMDLPDLPLEKRAEVQEQAHTRMKEGAALLASALAELSRAAPGNDFQAMQASVGEMREGLAQFESGLAAHRALAEGSAPRNVALSWFKREMNLSPPAPGAAASGLLGLSSFHFFSMLVLVAFAVAMIWMYFFKMRRAQQLLTAMAVSAPESAVVGESKPSPNSPSKASTAAQASPASKSSPASKASVSKQERPPKQAEKWSGRLKVCRIFQETPDTKTFRMVAVDGQSLPFRYLPGQFLTIAVEPDGRSVKRSYTIASSPTVQDYVEITVKREEHGLVSRFLHDTAEEGQEFKISAPSGRFTFTGEESEGIVLIAGGVGITPMMSVVRYLTDRGWEGAIYLFYCCKTMDDYIFREELEYLEKRTENLSVFVTMTREERPEWTGHRGRLSAESMASVVPDLNRQPIHICGPGPMLESTRAMLEEFGVRKENIRSESFGGAKTPKAGGASTAKSAQEQSSSSDSSESSSSESIRAPVSSETSSTSSGAALQATATFVQSEKSGPLGPGETVLDVAESLGVDIDSSCRTGTCGTCVVKLLDGQVSMETEDGLDPEDKAQGLILACQAMSEGAVVIDA